MAACKSTTRAAMPSQRRCPEDRTGGTDRMPSRLLDAPRSRRRENAIKFVPVRCRRVRQTGAPCVRRFMVSPPFPFFRIPSYVIALHRTDTTAAQPPHATTTRRGNSGGVLQHANTNVRGRHMRQGPAPSHPPRAGCTRSPASHTVEEVGVAGCVRSTQHRSAVPRQGPGLISCLRGISAAPARSYRVPNGLFLHLLGLQDQVSLIRQANNTQ